MCSRFWQMPRLSSDARYMMAYLLDSPHKRRFGYYYLPLEYASCDMGIPVEKIRKAIVELETSGLAKYDNEARMVEVIGKGEFAEKAFADDILKILMEVPASPLAVDMLNRLVATGCLHEDEFEKICQHPLGQEVFSLYEQQENTQAKEAATDTTPSEAQPIVNNTINDENSNELTAPVSEESVSLETPEVEAAAETEAETVAGEKDTGEGKSREPWEDDFDRLWAKYPRKLNKQNAKKAYHARLAKGEITYAVASRAIENYAYICKKNGTESQYILHGSTFFGAQKRFSEYLDDGEGIKDFRGTSLQEEEDALNKDKEMLAPKFNMFWAFYPKKEGRAVAESNFAYISKKDCSADDLISAAKNYSRKCEIDGKPEQFIMRADSFLDTKRKPFLDYLGRVEREAEEDSEDSFVHENNVDFEEAAPDEDFEAAAPDSNSQSQQNATSLDVSGVPDDAASTPDDVGNKGDSNNTADDSITNAEPLPDILWGDEDENFQIPDDDGFPDDTNYPF